MIISLKMSLLMAKQVYLLHIRQRGAIAFHRLALHTTRRHRTEQKHTHGSVLEDKGFRGRKNPLWGACTGQSKKRPNASCQTVRRGRSKTCLMQLPFTNTRIGTPFQCPGHPRVEDLPSVSGLVPFTGGEVEMLVQIQEHLLKEAQSLALCFLTALKHLLHVLHVAGIVAVQLF